MRIPEDYSWPLRTAVRAWNSIPKKIRRRIPWRVSMPLIWWTRIEIARHNAKYGSS